LLAPFLIIEIALPRDLAIQKASSRGDCSGEVFGSARARGVRESEKMLAVAEALPNRALHVDVCFIQDGRYINWHTG
jgi:hypothetical protein